MCIRDSPCTVVLDLSADIGTGLSGKGGYPELDTSKAGYAITLAATLLMFMHRHGEPIGLEIVAGDGVQHTSLPPRGGRQHLQQCMLSLASARPAGRAGLSRALAKVGDRTRRRSWVGVITDGMEEPEQWLGALSVFARRRTDLRFFHLFDRGEMDLQFRNPALFFSPEGGADLAVDPVGAKAAFHEVVQEYLDEVRQGVTRFGGQYMAVGTDRALEETIRTAVLSAAVAT